MILEQAKLPPEYSRPKIEPAERTRFVPMPGKLAHIWRATVADPRERLAMSSTFFIGTLRQAFDPEALDVAIAAVVARHPMLGAIITEQAGKPCWDLQPALVPPVETIDIPDPAGDEAALRMRLGEVVWREFPVWDEGGAQNLFRVRVCRIGDGRIVLAANIFKLLADDMSGMILLRDIEKFYGEAVAGKDVRAERARIDFSDHLASMSAWMESEGGRRELARRQHFVADFTPLILPADQPEDSRSDLVSQIDSSVDAATVRQVTAYCQAVGVDPYFAWLAALITTLCAKTGTRKAVVNGINAGRDQMGLFRVVGNFALGLPLAFSMEAKTTPAGLMQLLAAAAAQQTGYTPIDIATVDPALTQVTKFNFINFTPTDGGQFLDPVTLPVPAGAFTELWCPRGPFVLAIKDGERMRFLCSYATRYYSEEAVRAMMNETLARLRWLVSDPAQDCDPLSFPADSLG